MKNAQDLAAIFREKDETDLVAIIAAVQVDASQESLLFLLEVSRLINHAIERFRAELPGVVQ